MNNFIIEEDYTLLEDWLSNKPIKEVESKEQLFRDLFQTEEQKDRDELITDLLREYVGRFKKKNKETSNDRETLKKLAVSLIVTIVATIIIITLYTVFLKKESSWQSITAVASSLITLCGSLFGIINYMAERAFPKDDEKYITEIVNIIQENDLKHKQENIKAAMNSEFFKMNNKTAAKDKGKKFNIKHWFKKKADKKLDTE